MPKPLRHVFICTQGRPAGHPRGCCAQKGTPALMEAFWQELERRGLCASVALTNTGCLGPCHLGGTVLVYPEGVMYGGVTPEDVAAIVEEHLVGGRPVERLRTPPEVWG